jgi:hypothetical protein
LRASNCRYTWEKRFWFHFFVNLLARTYGIDDVVQYSASQAAILADALRGEDSKLFFSFIRIMLYEEGWGVDDPWKQFAIKHIRIVVEEDDAKQNEERKVLTEWICKGCDTVFRFLKPNNNRQSDWCLSGVPTALVQIALWKLKEKKQRWRRSQSRKEVVV